MQLFHRLSLVLTLLPLGLMASSTSAETSLDLRLPKGAVQSSATAKLPPGTQFNLFPHCERRLCGEQHWNFEPASGITTSSEASVQNWSGTIDGRSLGARSFAAGSSVLARRVVASPSEIPLPRGHEQIAAMRALGNLGGNYWDVPYHTGYEGLFWLGSYENRPTLGSSVGRPRGERATMDVTSPEFSIDSRGPRFVHFLVGGGCSREVRVELEERVYRRSGIAGCTKAEDALRAALATQQRECGPSGNHINCTAVTSTVAAVRRAFDECAAANRGAVNIDIASPVWAPVEQTFTNPVTRETTTSTPFRIIRSGRNCGEAMTRVTWDVGGLGRRSEDAGYRLRVVDASTTAHISIDDIWVTAQATVPEPKVPVWGVADLHAHLMNELSTMAFDGGGPAIAARALWGSTFGPVSNMNRCNALHTTNDNLDRSPHQFSMHEPEDPNAYTLCRDICLDMVDEASEPKGAHNTNGGYNDDWVGWPVASGAVHQQMHWSWVKRAWEGGLRLMIATVGNSEVIGYGLVGEGNHAFLSDQDALALQIPAIRRWAASPDVRDWAQIAYTPAEARRIISSGKLALLLGVELDHVMDDCRADVTTQRHHVARNRSSATTWASAHGYNVDVGETYDEHGELDILSSVLGTGATTWGNLLVSSKVMHYDGHPDTCTDAQIEARLDALYEAGVRHIIPMHFSDNLFGGFAITRPLFFANAIFGNRLANPPDLMTRDTGGVRLTEFTNDLGETITVPLWVSLDPLLLRSLVGGILPDNTPAAIQALADSLTSRCIEDDGWRAFFAVISLGATELNCLLTDEIRELTPGEGAVDSPAMMGLGIPAHLHAGPREALASHVNNRGLMPNGHALLTQMMRRGMLIDVQHASERAKNDVMTLLGTNPLALDGAPRYPLMASHGGVQLVAATGTIGTRANENTLSRAHFDRIYNTRSTGLVGIGTQSGSSFRSQIHDIRTALCGAGTTPCVAGDALFGIALGTDINGFDWHAMPRFAGGIGGGTRVNYSAYDRTTNPAAGSVAVATGSGATAGSDGRPFTVSGDPPLAPHQMSKGGRVNRTYDVNFDGLAHYGMIPDFLQDVHVLGATSDDLAPVFRSAEATLRMWEESCRQAFSARRSGGNPSNLSRGCGTREELGI